MKEGFIMKMTDEQKLMFDGLTRLQQLCSLERIKDHTASNREIYVRASKRYDIPKYAAKAYGYKILNHPSVVQFLATFNVEYIDDSIMSREEMIQRLSSIARHKVTDVVQVISPEQNLMDVETGEIFEGQSAFAIKRDADMSLVNEITKGKDGIKVKTHSQVEAMKQLAQLQGFNAPTKTEISGPDGGPIQTHELSDDEFAESLAKLGLTDDD